MKRGTSTVANTASATSPPTIQSITNMFNPCLSCVPAYQSGSKRGDLSGVATLHMLVQDADFLPAHAGVGLEFPERFLGELI